MRCVKRRTFYNAEKYKNTYDTIQFVTFEDNLKHTIADNLMFVNFTEDDYKNKKGDIDEKSSCYNNFFL